MKRTGTMPATDIEVSGTKTLRPTPDILDALEKDYPLEASVADLIDNSIDAGARRVLVRFMMREQQLVSLCIADNGRGMNEDQIDLAMQFAAKRRYGARDLGMFGVGLKTASLSLADTLTVLSRASGSPAVGRQWTKAGIKKRDWEVNVLTERSANGILKHRWGPLSPIRVGTVVRWDQVYDFDRLRQGIDAYLERAKSKLQLHLGLKLHRFLQRRKLQIQIDVEDTETAEVGPPTIVKALDPFPPSKRNGAAGYPKTFVARLPTNAKLKMRSHIWRKKSGDEGYKLGGGKVAEHQGFYFYRHDRLIQDGGWSDIIGTNEPHLSLARVEIDIPDVLGRYLRVRSNKAGVDVPASFADAVFAARSKDGVQFRGFLDKAEEVYRRRGALKPQPMLRPGDGIPMEVRKVLEKHSIPLVRGQPCSVIWGDTADGNFIQVNQENREVTLNRRYRKLLLRGAHGGKTDLPLVRTLLYFVFESALAGDRLGKVERLRIEAIRAAMNIALRAEKKWAVEQ
jgi:hypothetical protein